MSSYPQEEKFCIRCSNHLATLQCDCLECECLNKLCSACFKLGRCRKCSQNCRNWLFSFFTRINHIEPIMVNKIDGKTITTLEKSLSPVVKMKYLPILAEWESSIVWYTLDLSNQIHRRLLFRTKHELESEIHLHEAVFTIRENTSELVSNLKYELESIILQYEHQKKLLDKKCKYCDELSTLSVEEKQRHCDYHIQRSLLLLRKDNSCDDTIRFSMKTVKKYSLQNSTNNAMTQVECNIRLQEQKVEKMFQNIKSMPIFCLPKLDIPVNDEGSERKRRKTQFTSPWDNKDNKRCLTCNEEFIIGLDDEQDWAYNKNCIRVNEMMYCSIECVQDRLSEIKIEQPSRNQDDNAKCPTCDRIFAYYQMGNMVMYYNDFLYDSGCDGNAVIGCKGDSCATIRVDNVIYCNARCAKLIAL